MFQKKHADATEVMTDEYSLADSDPSNSGNLGRGLVGDSIPPKVASETLYYGNNERTRGKSITKILVVRSALTILLFHRISEFLGLPWCRKCHFFFLLVTDSFATFSFHNKYS